MESCAWRSRAAHARACSSGGGGGAPETCVLAPDPRPPQHQTTHSNRLCRNLWDENVLEIRRVKPGSQPGRLHRHSEWALHSYLSRFPRPLVGGWWGGCRGKGWWWWWCRRGGAWLNGRTGSAARPGVLPFLHMHSCCSTCTAALPPPALLPTPPPTHSLQAAREYQYARRVWHRPADGGCYVLCRGMPLPDAGAAARACCRCLLYTAACKQAVPSPARPPLLPPVALTHVPSPPPPP